MLGERYRVMKCTSATEYLHFYLILDIKIRYDCKFADNLLCFELFRIFFCTRRIVFSFETTAMEEVQFAN